VAVSVPGLVQQLPGAPTTAESAPNLIGLITLDMKQAGKRSAGKPHAAFDVAGVGNVAMVVESCTHSAIERAALETLHLQPARLPSTLPVGGWGKRNISYLARSLPNLLWRVILSASS
jgi:hypothetical protein